MKTSKQIILSIAILIIAAVIVYVFVLRASFLRLHSMNEAKYQHETIVVKDFEKISFTSRMYVRITQGKDCTVEIITNKNSSVKPVVDIIDGTLYCIIDSVSEKQNADSIRIRITLPLLKEIKAARGTDVFISNFMADSLNVILSHGCVFTGKNNTLNDISFHTSGDNEVQITNTF
jgi:hypothetical protein